MTSPRRYPGFVEWLVSHPDHVPDHMVRYYIYWRVFYFLGAIGHAIALVQFWNSGVTFMVYFNIFSVIVFVGAFVLLRRGVYQLPFWAVNTELILHGIAATVCVGPLYGFQFFAFLVVILAYIQPFYTWRVSSCLAGTALLAGAAVTLYGAHYPPLYEIPVQWRDINVVLPMITWPLFVLAMVLPFVRASARAERELAAAYGESESLLLNILPAPIAGRLKATHGMIADDHDRVAILFADIVGFTTMSDRLPPAEVVTLLNSVFNAIDDLVERYRVEKIKTIGDAYMVVAGVPQSIADPDETIARLAIDIQETVKRFKVPGTGEPLQMRIGVNSGRVVAGVIGQRKFAYDLWGDAVNVAARLEATGEPGRIQVTDAFAAGLADRFVFERRGAVEIKGKGSVETSFLAGAKAD